MSKRKFLHSRYSPLFLALAAIFSSGPAVCEARVTIAAGHEQTTIPVDTALSNNTLKDGNGAAVSNAGIVGKDVYKRQDPGSGLFRLRWFHRQRRYHHGRLSGKIRPGHQ